MRDRATATPIVAAMIATSTTARRINPRDPPAAVIDGRVRLRCAHPTPPSTNRLSALTKTSRP